MPTEAEWEYAARNGRNTAEKYSWGDSLVQAGKFRANVWQGHFPHYFSNEDGFKTTSPVGYFGKNRLGLSDMGGNVWEWCADVYRSYPGHLRPVPVDTTLKVQKGGSFLCNPKVCYGFRVSARQACPAETALMHTGFRTAYSPASAHISEGA